MTTTTLACIAVGLLLGATGQRAATAAASPRRARTGGDPALAARATLVSELERLTDGLLFMSESDFPLSVVTWPHAGAKPTADRIAALAGEPHPEVFESMTVDAFFAAAVTPRAWHDDEERGLARRFAAIVLFLKTHLTNVRVFRFGRLTIHAYVVGVTPTGDWMGLTTTQIET
jgi:hypothetical protein